MSKDPNAPKQHENDKALETAQCYSSSRSESNWKNQKDALDRARAFHGNFVNRRRSRTNDTQSWKRETFSLPRVEAQQRAKAFLLKYPKAAYWSEVETWRELPGDIIEFTMRRLPTAD